MEQPLQAENAQLDTRSLTDLPSHVLLNILSQLDLPSLCSCSRSCTLLSKMAAHNSLPIWENFKHDGWVLWDVKCTLGRILRLPPQVFQVQLDVKRSRKFPITVPLHNLRSLLGVTDTDELAERVSKAVQDQVADFKLWRFSSWQHLPPAASISCCRADRSAVRASLRPEAVVPRLVRQLQHAGWPPQAPTAAAGTFAGGLKDGHSSSCTAAPALAATSSAGDGSSQLLDTNKGAFGSDDRSRSQHRGLTGQAAVVPPADAMDACLKVCRSRLHLLLAGQLQGLVELAQSRSGSSSSSTCAPGRASSPGSGEPRERLAALQLGRQPSAHVMAAAAGKLPDAATARQAAITQLSISLPQHAAKRLAPAAVQLMFLGAAADPSSVTFSVPGRPGWVLLLQQATKVLLRLHTLQRMCLCSMDGRQQVVQQQPVQEQEQQGVGTGSSPQVQEQLQLHQPPLQLCQILSACHTTMEAAWPSASAAELHLCLTGLQEFGRVVDSSKCSPATLFNCLLALEAAASEYPAAMAEEGASDAIARSVGGRPASSIEYGDQSSMARLLQADGAGGGSSGLLIKPELVRGALHVEALRCLSWCLWLLGVGV